MTDIEMLKTLLKCRKLPLCPNRCALHYRKNCDEIINKWLAEYIEKLKMQEDDLK